MSNLNQVLNIKWNGQEVFVLVTCDEQNHTYKTTAYENKNRTQRVWDERINSFFDTKEELAARVKTLQKKAV